MIIKLAIIATNMQKHILRLRILFIYLSTNASSFSSSVFPKAFAADIASSINPFSLKLGFQNKNGSSSILGNTKIGGGQYFVIDLISQIGKIR